MIAILLTGSTQETANPSATAVDYAKFLQVPLCHDGTNSTKKFLVTDSDVDQP